MRSTTAAGSPVRALTRPVLLGVIVVLMAMVGLALLAEALSRGARGGLHGRHRGAGERAAGHPVERRPRRARTRHGSAPMPAIGTAATEGR